MRGRPGSIGRAQTSLRAFRHASPARRLFGCATVARNRLRRAKLWCEQPQGGTTMSDYRNSSDPLYRDPNGPMTGNAGYVPAARTNAGWGWIAGAIFLVIILAIAFGVGHEPNRVASNDMTPSA